MREPQEIIDQENVPEKLKYGDSYLSIDLPKGKKEAELKKVLKVKELFEEAKNHRASSCFWQLVGGDDGLESNWVDRFEKQFAAYLRYSFTKTSLSTEEHFRAPMVTGRVNAFMAQFKALNLGWGASPNDAEDVYRAKIGRELLDSWYEQSDAEQEINQFALNLAIHGTAIMRTHYKQEYKRVRLLNKDRAEEGEDKYITKDIPVYDDVTVENIPLEEFYIDPYATDINNGNKKARYVVRRHEMSIQEFRRVYGSKENAQHIDMVKPATNYDSSESGFFSDSKKDGLKDMVQVLEFEGQAFEHNDDYFVVANDVLVIDGVLPNHKEISYHKANFINLPGQFYGLGIADLVLDYQLIQELLMTMGLDHIYRSIRSTTIVDSSVMEDLAQAFDSEDPDVIPVNTNGRNVRDLYAELKISPLTNDWFNMVQMQKDYASESSLIDPQQIAMVQKNATATEILVNQERLQAMYGSVLTEMTSTAFKSAGRQIYKLFQQFYTVPKVKREMGDEEGELKPEFRTIKLNGKKIEIGEDNEVAVKETSDYSYFEIKDEYLNTKDEMDVFVRPDTIETKSKAVNMKKAMEIFQMFIPYAVDTTNVMARMQNPQAFISLQGLSKYVFEHMDLPEEVLLSDIERDDVAYKEAMIDMTKIINGEDVAGKPGRSEAHREVEANVLNAIRIQREKLEQKINDEQEERYEEMLEEYEASIKINPATGQPEPPRGLDGQILPPPEMPLVPPQQQQELDNLLEIEAKVKRHLEVDNMPAGTAVEASVMQSDATSQSVQPAQPPQGQQQPPQPQNAGNQQLMQGRQDMPPSPANT